MAQLIKLYDHISRYEWNMYRYPSQYIRLKKDDWESVHSAWLSGEMVQELEEDDKDVQESSNLSRIKNLFTRSKSTEPKKKPAAAFIKNELQLRKHFLDNIYPFQIKWATSTLSEISILDEGVETDETLKYFLQRFPDIYLIMYYPVFNIRNAPIDGEIIMISPTNIEIITLVEYEPSIRIMAGDERRWAIETQSGTEQIISPVISLRRSESIIKSILKNKQLQYPIKRSVISRTNQIIFNTEPFNTNIVGIDEYDKWIDQKRSISSPLKKEQLKVAETLINFCISTSVRRPEWERDDDIFPIGE